MSEARFFCYTDGACKKGEKPPGGWGLFIKCPEGTEVEKSGGELDTSISRMELTAILQALEWLPAGASAVVFSDSKSALDYCSRWLAIWKKSDWRNAEPGILDLVQKIEAILSEKKLEVEWQWVRGHGNNRGNGRADWLAGEGLRAVKKKRPELPVRKDDP